MKKLLTLLFLLISVNCYGATWYVDGSVSISGDGTTEATAKKTIHEGVGLMASGDTLIIADGTYTGSENSLNRVYTNIPNGTINSYTTIKAKNDFGVQIVYGTAVDIYDGQYITIEGIKFDANLSGLVLQINSSDHIKLKKCSFTGAKVSTWNITAVSLAYSQYILVEDCWAWGTGRYKFACQTCSYVVFRRCIARHDYHPSSQCATFVRYDSNNIHFQNCIAIDKSTGPTGGWYGGFWNERNAITDTTGSDKGCIVLNSGQGFNDYKVWGTRIYENCIAWGVDSSKGFHLGFYNDNIGTTSIDHCTSGGITGNGSYGTGDAYYWELDPGTINITNSIAVSCGRSAFEKDFAPSWTGLDYNAIYGMSVSNYDNATAGANDITNVDILSASLLYLPRIENSSSLDGAASDSGDIGATILKQHGTSGTLYGEEGWDTLTDIDLWPWPNENEIRDDMAAWNEDITQDTYSSVDVVGARGFCASTANPRTPTGEITLTSYIWEYLGNTGMTASLYGEDTTAPSDISTLSAATGTNVGEVALSWTAPGDDAGTGTVSSYDIRYSTSEITAGNFASATAASTSSYTIVTAGGTQNVTVIGLTGGTTYYFAVKASDEIPNTSAISNVDSAAAKDYEVTPTESYASSTALIQASQVTCDLTITNSPNRRVVIFTAAEESGTDHPILSVTYGSISATKITSVTATTTSKMHVEAWEIKEADLPSSGTFTVTATATGNCNGLAVVAMCWYNIAQGDVIYETVTKLTEEPTISDIITTAVDGSRVVCFLGDGDYSDPVEANDLIRRVHVAGIDATMAATLSDKTVTTAGETTVGFSNLTIRRCAMITLAYAPYSYAPDSNPPDAIYNLSAEEGPLGSSRRISFTEKGDDGNSGTCSGFYIRYDTGDSQAFDWDTATVVDHGLTPQGVGNGVTYLLSGLANGTQYTIGVKSYDDIPNLSAISNLVTFTTRSADTNVFCGGTGEIH